LDGHPVNSSKMVLSLSILEPMVIEADSKESRNRLHRKMVTTGACAEKTLLCRNHDVSERLITLWGVPCQDRFEGYWMERVHHKLSGEMKPGRYKRSRVVSAGDPCRAGVGLDHVFVIIVKNYEFA
jgi:hypothetical protein